MVFEKTRKKIMNEIEKAITEDNLANLVTVEARNTVKGDEIMLSIMSKKVNKYTRFKNE